jgi:GR25 family glycosyltransferase involved in LPS biosynthesis
MFDAVLYINLEHRKDRNSDILSELSKLECKNIHRIEAVLDSVCGHIGCAKSHVKALEFAIESNWDSVLVAEDDLKFTDDLPNLYKINDIPWDVMLLGYGHKTLVDCEHLLLKRVIKSSCTHGYIVRKHYYRTLLENFQESIDVLTQQLKNHIEECNKKGIEVTKLISGVYAIDQSWLKLQSKDIFYVFEPQIGIQSKSVSDNNCSFEYQSNMLKTLHQSEQS